MRHAVAMLLASAPRVEGAPPKPPAPACVNREHRSALTRLSARPALLLPRPLCRTRAPERVRHGQAERSSSPLLLPPLRPSSVRTKRGITFSSFRRPFLRPSPAAQPARAPSPAQPLWMVRAHAWPGHRGPPPASSSAHTGAGGHSGAHAILPRRRQASSGRHREPLTASSALIYVKDFAQEFEEREGPICNVIDSCE